MDVKTLKISLPKGVWEVINKDLGWLGNTESARIQNIIISSTLLNSYKTNSDKYACSDYKYNLDVLEYMIDSVVELLEDKNIISSKEWRARVQQRIFTSLSV
jgi:hypothetical protein